MKRNLRLALAGVGSVGMLAVPIALVACGSSDVTLSATSLQYLANTRATSFGSQKLQPTLLNVIRGETLTFARANASTFGIKVPALPSGVYVTVKKDAASDDVVYSFSKGEIKKSSTVSFKTFAFNQEAADSDNAVAILSAIDSTALSDSAFKAVTVSANTTLTSAVASSLGIRMPVLESNVLVKVEKSANSAAISFSTTVGATNKPATATVTKFAVSRDAEDLDTAAAALATVTWTSKDQKTFTDLTIDTKTPVTEGVTSTLGIYLPTLPAGTSLQVQKGSDTTIKYSLAKNAATKDVSVTLTKFSLTKDEADVDAGIAVLGKVDVSTKDEATFKAIAVEEKEFSAILPEVAKKEVKNYLFFLGTTACPVCNTALLGANGRANYSVEPDINTYTAAFPTAASKLRSNTIIDEFFIWEDLAGGYGDAGDEKVPGGNADYFPWSTARSGGQSAETFKAVEQYLGKTAFSSPMLLVVKDGKAKIDTVTNMLGTADEIYTSIQTTYFPTSTTT